jgi:predicted small integral membrane protein
MDVLDQADGHILRTIFLMLVGMLVWELKSPTIERRGLSHDPTTRGTRFFWDCWAAPTSTWPGWG